MPRLAPTFSLCLALSLPVAALAQSTPGDTAEAVAVTWLSNQDTDPATGTRQCSVFPLGDGAFPMFFFYGPDVEISLQGTNGTPMGLKLQVDANPELDGGFPSPSPEVATTLIEQIRANGQNLRLSRMVVANGKLQNAIYEFPLAGAVEEFDKCRAWIGQ